MSGNFAIKGGGVKRLMANAILNFHFDFLNPSLRIHEKNMECWPFPSKTEKDHDLPNCNIAIIL